MGHISVIRHTRERCPLYDSAIYVYVIYHIAALYSYTVLALNSITIGNSAHSFFKLSSNFNIKIVFHSVDQRNKPVVLNLYTASRVVVHCSSSYLWKIPFCINHQKRCFPAASISHNHNFQFFYLFSGSTISSLGTVLCHLASKTIKQVPDKTELKSLPPQLSEIHSKT